MADMTDEREPDEPEFETQADGSDGKPVTSPSAPPTETIILKSSD